MTFPIRRLDTEHLDTEAQIVTQNLGFVVGECSVLDASRQDAAFAGALSCRRATAVSIAELAAGQAIA
jgi:hypothetical protein